MRLSRLIAVIAATLAAACAAVPQEPAHPTYYVMRHLDTPAGERDPDLTAGGRAKAERLAAWGFGPAPAAIYVSGYRRTQQTAAPLAARLGLTPIVYDAADTTALVARVRAGPSPALVVGHSNTVPDIVEQLGGDAVRRERPAERRPGEGPHDGLARHGQPDALVRRAHRRDDPGRRVHEGAVEVEEGHGPGGGHGTDRAPRARGDRIGDDVRDGRRYTGAHRRRPGHHR